MATSANDPSDAQSTPTRKQTKPKEPTAAEKFRGQLTGAPHYPLKRVAKALFAANTRTQTALLASLQRGELVASAHWPKPGDITDLPPVLWTDVRNSDFQVRFRTGGQWKARTYSLPRSLLIQHLVVPCLLGSAIRPRNVQTVSLDNEQLAAPIEDRVKVAINMLQTGISKGEVVVTAENAYSFADKSLGGVGTQTNSKRKTDDVSKLIIEMLRLVHMTPRDKWPSKETIVYDLLTWWNHHLADRPSRRKDWIELYVEMVLAEVKKSKWT